MALGGLVVVRSIRIVQTVPDGAVVLALLIVGTVGFVWFLFAFFWIRGQLRSRAVRRLLPSAVLFEVVMTVDLADRILLVEGALGQPTPRIWPQTYLTVAATGEALWFFGGSFRAVRRGRIPADGIRSVTLKTIDFPTQTVTRHFPAMVMAAGDRFLELGMLPLRTTFMIPRKLTPQQLENACRAVAAELRVPLDPPPAPRGSA